MQLIVLLQGIINQNYVFVSAYLFSLLAFSTVLSFILLHKKQQNSMIDHIISAEEIIEQLPGHIYWKNTAGVCLGCNTQNWRDFGLQSIDDFIGKTDYDLFTTEEADKLREADLEVINSGKIKIVEEWSANLSGVSALYLSHKIPLKDSNGKTIGILGISLDITETKKETVERLAMLENIIALMPGHVYWIDREGVYLGCNDNQAISAGLNSRKEIVGRRNKELPWNFNAGLLSKILDEHNTEVMDTGQDLIVEEPAILQDNSEAIFYSKKFPMRNLDGKIVGMIGISIDITQRKKMERELQKAQERLMLINASIAHELRTPLASLEVSAGHLQKSLPQLLEAAELALQANLPVRDLHPAYIRALKPILEGLQQEARAGLLFIDMLLMNANPTVDKQAFEIFSMASCVEEALKRYPFKKEQRKLINCRLENNFLLKGQLLFMEHVLFNLIKNAFYYIVKSNKADSAIYIWLEQGTENNKLYFKDTGTGIAANILPHIFERFFSKTHRGAGVGLTFCKMVIESFGGSIFCSSKEGEYTQFELDFPLHVDEAAAFRTARD